MVLLEFIFSSVKLFMLFVLLLLLIFFLVFKLQCGLSSFFHDRGLVFFGRAEAYKDSKKLANNFDPIFKKQKILQFKDRLYIEGVITPRIKFKKLMSKKGIDHEIFKK
jgi:hypothetical protein